MKTDIQKPIPALTLVLANHDKLCLLAFQNSLQANIISTVSNGKLIIVNNAASKLLGYSNKGLLTKYRSNIFDINESSFKKMLKQRTASGYSKALLTGIKKSGKQFPCEITSAVFIDERGITLAITTIADLSQSILKQKVIDTKNNKTVAANIVLAKSAQKIIDTKNKKIVADNIDMAKSKQKIIDKNKEKIVADNILLAQSRSDARQAENNEYQKELKERFEQEIKLKQKQMTEAIEEAKETVRSHIGKELHDNINQLLAVSRMYLLMAKKGGASSQLYLTRSSEYTIKAIEEIRKLTKSLSADIINDLGLCEAIEGIGRDTMEATPLKIFYALSSFLEHSVGYKFKLNILRIVQEHLNNILKHAKATEVNISLLQNKRAIMLSISDNGIGFDTEKKQNGIGIANIKSRAIAYNGMAEFVSQPGNGCVLTARFMLTDPDEK